MKALSYVLQYFAKGRFDTEPALRRFHRAVGIRTRWWRYAIPAAAAVALVSFASYRYINTWTRYEAYDIAQSFTLKDGSRVLLSPGSTLSLQPHRNPRAVTMDGRGLFDVVHNESRPFEVFSKNGYIKVLGTVFSLDSGKGAASVISGKVYFAKDPGAGGLVLTAGESAVLEGGAPSRQAALNPLAWANGKFVYREAPLDAALQELSGYYGHTIVPAQGIEGKTITGTFDAADEESILLAIEAATGIKLEVIR